jgi:hypothetical protein
VGLRKEPSAGEPPVLELWTWDEDELVQDVFDREGE